MSIENKIIGSNTIKIRLKMYNNSEVLAILLF